MIRRLGSGLATKAAAAIFYFGALSTPASSAEIELIKTGDPDKPNVVFIFGELVEEDIRKFANIAISIDNAIVSLTSPGGKVTVGIAIGEAIRLKGFKTAVFKGQTCASACALIWLGGRARFKEESARIGFHAAWRDTGAGPEAASVGNALVGAYLQRLSFSTLAIAYMTMSGPKDMTWITDGDAKALGIDMVTFAMNVSKPAEPKPTPAPEPKTVAPAEQPIIKPPPALVLSLLNADHASRVQSRLIALGYLTGQADGVWGMRSRRALRAFKREAGLPFDDRWDVATEERLFDQGASPSRLAANDIAMMPAFESARFDPPTGTTLHPLNISDALKLQGRLRELGYYRARGDGTWGPGSRHALREFKVANGLGFTDEWTAAAESQLFRSDAWPAAASVFGTWSTNNSCQRGFGDQMRVWGTRVEFGQLTCDVSNWVPSGPTWTGTAVCTHSARPAQSIVTLRFSVDRDRLVDQSSSPSIHFSRCQEQF